MAKQNSERSHEDVQQAAGPVSQEIDKHQAAEELGAKTPPISPNSAPRKKSGEKLVEQTNPKKTVGRRKD